MLVCESLECCFQSKTEAFQSMHDRVCGPVEMLEMVVNTLSCLLKQISPEIDSFQTRAKCNSQFEDCFRRVDFDWLANRPRTRHLGMQERETEAGGWPIQPVIRCFYKKSGVSFDKDHRHRGHEEVSSPQQK